MTAPDDRLVDIAFSVAAGSKTALECLAQWKGISRDALVDYLLRLAMRAVDYQRQGRYLIVNDHSGAHVIPVLGVKLPEQPKPKTGRRRRNARKQVHPRAEYRNDLEESDNVALVSITTATHQALSAYCYPATDVPALGLLLELGSRLASALKLGLQIDVTIRGSRELVSVTEQFRNA